MRRFFLIMLVTFLLVLVAEVGLAQGDTLYSYYNKEGLPVAKDTCTYIVKAYRVKDGYYAVGYYRTTNALISENTFLDSELKIHHGESKSYYDIGSIMTSGTYDKGVKIGTWKNYYWNGGLQDSIIFKNNQPVEHYELTDNRILKSYLFDSINKKIAFIAYYYNGSKVSEGSFNMNLEKIGTWTTYADDKIFEVLEYDNNGKLLKKTDGKGKDKGNYFAKNSIPPKKAMNITPQFPGGDEAFSYYISRSVQNPVKNKFSNLDIFPATAKIDIVLDKEGKVIDVVLLQTVHPFVDEELKKCFKRMPTWDMNGFAGTEFHYKLTLTLN